MSTEVETGTPATIETPEPVAQPAPTLAEHRAEFPLQSKVPAPATDGTPPARPRHRARSQQASPDDIKEIDELTKRLRETEKAIPIDRKTGESDRAYELRRRVEIAERASKGTAPAPIAPVVARPAAPNPVVAPTDFTEKEPQLADFASEADPYAAWQRSLARFDRRKDEFDAQQKTTQLERKAQIEVFDREINDGINQHVQRIGAFMMARPELKALFDAEAAKPPHEQIQLPIALRGAIEFHERGPEFLVHLLQNPDFADELFLLTNGRPVGDPRSDPLVASVRRRLLQRMPDVKTGAPATPRPVTIAPRPPTPVRTAPQTPREKAPSEPAGSLAEHRRRFPLH